MASAPQLVVLDVNETLSDLSGMASRFADVGARPELAPVWFAGVLRDGFALAAAGSAARFGDLARHNLAELLRDEPLQVPVEDAVAAVVAGLGELELHPDVAPGLHGLAGTGTRLVTLSNGSTTVADALLTRARVRPLVERLLTVEDAPRWKPAPESYAYALEACGVRPGDAMLVAVHPWDIDGAARAGMRTAWVNRTGRVYPPAFAVPEVVVDSLTGLVAHLAGGTPVPATSTAT